MKIIFKYLKPFAVLVLCSVAFLLCQAYCDLSLPNVMSNIVNVGIQAGGITESFPKQMSSDSMLLLSKFMSDKDEQTFKMQYTSADGVFTQNKNSDPDAGYIYGRACYAMVNFLTQNADTNAVNTSSENPENVDLSVLYKTLMPLLDKYDGKLDSFAIVDNQEPSAMIVEQYGKSFTKLLYTESGVDVAAIQRGYILQTGGKMLGIALLSVVAAIAVGFCSSKIGAGMSRTMRHDVFSKVESFSNAEFDKFSTASLITRTTNDVNQIQMLAIMGLRMMMYAPIMGIGGAFMALNKSMSLSWIIALAVVVLIGFVAVMFSIAVPKFNILQKMIDKLNLVSRESLSGMMVIRAFGNERHEEQRFDAANDDLTKTNRFVHRAMSLMMPFMNLLMNVVMLLIVWVGAREISQSTLQIGDMMAFMQYAMQIIMSFLMIAMMFIMVPRAAVSAKRINEVLNTENEIVDSNQPKHISKSNGGRTVEFKDVSFRYENAEDDVLTDINFVAKPGQTTALIGSTGSGKSTVINLIPRFYDVTQGSIELDGIDIREIPQKELRNEIGFIPQKGTLFSGTVKSNIMFGGDNISDNEINKAIEIAQASDFVSNLEEGIDSPIAQGGDNVSGGQKQRLAIARALAKNAPIYIFDDSFSALDFKTDAALRKELAKSTGGSTVIIVAQRVSTIMNADNIIVMNDGIIVGQGTHRELLANCDTYREIAESQLSKEELA
ncbi:MAG: ABC transporter ATP-binding protein [Oscillospiraceae bacterium]